MRQALKQHYSYLVNVEPYPDRIARLAWRLKCFDDGRNLAEWVEDKYFLLDGKRVLDVACAWGAHALAFAEAGARVTASDINDHSFKSLEEFARARWLPLETLIADCHAVPRSSHSFDVILALELIEHIDSPALFAEEVNRLLAPGGICILSTPPRCLSFFWGEPHYRVKYLTALPLPLQKFVATKLLKKQYPYPIPRQYCFASSVTRPFTDLGLTVEVEPQPFTYQLPLKGVCKEIFWKRIAVRKASL